MKLFKTAVEVLTADTSFEEQLVRRVSSGDRSREDRIGRVVFLLFFFFVFFTPCLTFFLFFRFFFFAFFVCFSLECVCGLIFGFRTLSLSRFYGVFLLQSKGRFPLFRYYFSTSSLFKRRIGNLTYFLIFFQTTFCFSILRVFFFFPPFSSWFAPQLHNFSIIKVLFFSFSFVPPPVFQFFFSFFFVFVSFPAPFNSTLLNSSFFHLLPTRCFNSKRANEINLQEQHIFFQKGSFPATHLRPFLTRFTLIFISSGGDQSRLIFWLRRIIFLARGPFIRCWVFVCNFVFCFCLSLYPLSFFFFLWPCLVIMIFVYAFSYLCLWAFFF